MHKKYMEAAYKEAVKAYKNDEVPVGAVIVKDNKIISTGYNKKESTNLATAHAEIIAINKACKKLKSWRLNDCEMYVTLEPCQMCLGAIKEARIKKVYFLTKRDKINKIKTNKVKINLTNKSSNIISVFFKEKR